MLSDDACDQGLGVLPQYWCSWHAGCLAVPCPACCLTAAACPLPQVHYSFAKGTGYQLANTAWGLAKCVADSSAAEDVMGGSYDGSSASDMGAGSSSSSSSSASASASSSTAAAAGKVNPQLWQQLQEAALVQLAEPASAAQYEPINVVNLAWAVAKVRLPVARDSAGRSLTDLLVAAAAAQQAALHCTQWAILCWAVASRAPASKAAAAEQLVEELMGHGSGGDSSSQPTQPDTSSAAATAASAEAYAQLLDAVHAACLQQPYPPDLKPYHITGFAYAAARAAQLPSQFVPDLLRAAAVCLPAFDLEVLTRMISMLARSGKARQAGAAAGELSQLAQRALALGQEQLAGVLERPLVVAVVVELLLCLAGVQQGLGSARAEVLQVSE